MLLKGKNAVVYGGGGSIGGAVARAFAREGAEVHLAGRTESKLEAVANEIRDAGGTTHTALLDALDAAAVNAHAETVVRIDISFNAIGHNDIQGTPMAEMDVDDYLSPVLTGARTNFLTWKAAAKHGSAGDPRLRRVRPADGRLQHRRATLEDVGNVAAFVASDRARTMTAATVNVSCGALID
jgi:3-oxoacyl-[acyl-carrier protein] reductase